jgi:predicted nucleic acid-binding protein
VFHVSDEPQSTRAAHHIERALQADETTFIPDVVVAELAWVLPARPERFRDVDRNSHFSSDPANQRQQLVREPRACGWGA